jgi:hypothetical protein
MADSVCAPQRWQRISATVGTSILPLILMSPQGPQVPAFANGHRKVQLPAVKRLKRTLSLPVFTNGRSQREKRSALPWTAPSATPGRRSGLRLARLADDRDHRRLRRTGGHDRWLPTRPTDARLRPGLVSPPRTPPLRIWTCMRFRRMVGGSRATRALPGGEIPGCATRRRGMAAGPNRLKGESVEPDTPARRWPSRTPGRFLSHPLRCPGRSGLLSELGSSAASVWLLAPCR